MQKQLELFGNFLSDFIGNIEHKSVLGDFRQICRQTEKFLLPVASEIYQTYDHYLEPYAHRAGEVGSEFQDKNELIVNVRYFVIPEKTAEPNTHFLSLISNTLGTVIDPGEIKIEKTRKTPDREYARCILDLIDLTRTLQWLEDIGGDDKRYYGYSNQFRDTIANLRKFYDHAVHILPETRKFSSCVLSDEKRLPPPIPQGETSRLPPDVIKKLREDMRSYDEPLYPQEDHWIGKDILKKKAQETGLLVVVKYQDEEVYVTNGDKGSTIREGIRPKPFRAKTSVHFSSPAGKGGGQEKNS